MSSSYDSAFYDSQKDGSLNSAKVVVPKVLSMLNPASVLDVGCGIGTWLTVFEEEGISDFLGLDGDYVSRETLKIEPNHFVATDLSQKFTVSKKFDLAISLEVGEHLPEISADNFIMSITQAANIVLFSAAIPGQDGTAHINEQYPEWWAKKFEAQGFKVIDAFRKFFWKNDQIEVWYRQNMLLYVKEEEIKNLSTEIQQAYNHTDPDFLTHIHPGLFNYYVGKFKQLSSMEGYLRWKLYPLKKAFRKKR